MSDFSMKISRALAIGIMSASLEQLERWRELARHVGRAEALFE